MTIAFAIPTEGRGLIFKSDDENLEPRGSDRGTTGGEIRSSEVRATILA